VKQWPGMRRKNWIDTIGQDLKESGMTWEEALESYVDRGDWCQCVTQCVFDTG